MDTRIFKNSYLILLLSFIILSIVFYILKIGFTTQIVDGEIVRKFNWKYPLAIALLIWVLWHFYLYPSNDSKSQQMRKANSTFSNSFQERVYCNPKELDNQRINMINWT